jgi:hypothetical protein
LEPIAPSRLAAKREAFRLWFEYLKIARLSTNRKVREALKIHGPFYARWEMDEADKFDPWWKTHGHLFEEKFVVRELKAGELPADADAIILEIPLTQSVTVLTKRVKAILQSALDAQQRTRRKGTKKPTAAFRLSDGAEPKLVAVREMLTVYRDVYLKNPTLRGGALLDAAHKHYLSRRVKKYRKVPMALQYATGDKITAMRNLRRYIQKAEKIVLNVASGQFPGDY